METLLIVWLGMIGATVGSFLNVVVYRLPRSESIVSPPSHCPKCNHKIRPYDNLPIVGWFLLGGKCRDCKLPINFRYPLVETLACVIVTTFAVLLFPVELTFIRPTYDATANCFISVPMAFHEVLIRVFWLSTFHLFLLTLGLIEFDKQTLSAKWLAFFLIPFLILGMCCPFLFPVSRYSYWFPYASNFKDIFEIGKVLKRPSMLSSQKIDLLAGTLAGFVFGRIALWSMKQTKTNKTLWSIAAIATGLFFGWQMALTIFVGALLLNGVVIFVTRQSYALLSLATVSFFVNVAMLLMKW
ncbi:MAG: prepilin peptidase [Planctomycetaceae bacterium]|jgi:prepilin signal peptidase PulO-like enzyme (type II secretory pathway)|nr:prepilin peptidase [Planctomycetaceae bacterium]